MMFRLFGEIFDRLFVILCALLFVQAPLFIDQYTHRLSGHVAELTLQVDAIKNVAAQTGKTLEGYIQKFLNSSDMEFVLQGKLLQGMDSRFLRLSDSLAALKGATPMIRPFTFTTHLDPEIAKNTFYNFQPGFSFTIETAAFGVMGMFFGLFFISLFKGVKARFAA